MDHPVWKLPISAEQLCTLSLSHSFPPSWGFNTSPLVSVKCFILCVWSIKCTCFNVKWLCLIPVLGSVSTPPQYLTCQTFSFMLDAWFWTISLILLIIGFNRKYSMIETATVWFFRRIKLQLPDLIKPTTIGPRDTREMVMTLVCQAAGRGLNPHDVPPNGSFSQISMVERRTRHDACNSRI